MKTEIQTTMRRTGLQPVFREKLKRTATSRPELGLASKSTYLSSATVPAKVILNQNRWSAVKAQLKLDRVMVNDKPIPYFRPVFSRRTYYRGLYAPNGQAIPLQKCDPPKMGIEDYRREEEAALTKLLKMTLKRSGKGTISVILQYGPAGTGKTTNAENAVKKLSEQGSSKKIIIRDLQDLKDETPDPSQVVVLNVTQLFPDATNLEQLALELGKRGFSVDGVVEFGYKLLNDNQQYGVSDPVYIETDYFDPVFSIKGSDVLYLLPSFPEELLQSSTDHHHIVLADDICQRYSIENKDGYRIRSHNRSFILEVILIFYNDRNSGHLTLDYTYSGLLLQRAIQVEQWLRGLWQISDCPVDEYIGNCGQSFDRATQAGRHLWGLKSIGSHEDRPLDYWIDFSRLAYLGTLAHKLEKPELAAPDSLSEIVKLTSWHHFGLEYLFNSGPVDFGRLNPIAIGYQREGQRSRVRALIEKHAQTILRLAPAMAYDPIFEYLTAHFDFRT